MKPTLLKMKRENGVAGQVAFHVEVTYSADTEPRKVSFIGSIYGAPGPIMMFSDGFPDGVRVDDPGRFGEKFNADWVSAFYD